MASPSERPGKGSARYRVHFTRQAEKDIAKLTEKLRAKIKDIVRNRLAVDPTAARL